MCKATILHIAVVSLCKELFLLVIVGCSLLEEESKVWSLNCLHSFDIRFKL
jgi:hypothetical protein